MWKVRPKQKMNKINSRWEYGIFVGVRPRSGEVWVATREGLEKVRSVRRIPFEDRWGDDCINWVKHAPWNRYKGDEDADGEIPEEKLAEDVEIERPERGMKEVIVKMREVVPREFQIRKEDAEKHGYTRGCAGCSSWFRGLGRQPHNDACRRRFAEMMKEDARVKNAMKRKDDFEEKVLEKQKIRQEKKAKKMAERAKNKDTKSTKMKRGAEEAGVEEGAEDRTKRKMDDVTVLVRAGEEVTLKPNSEDVEMTAARGVKRSAEDLDAHANVQAVRERWADLEDSEDDEEEDEHSPWEKNIVGDMDEEAVQWISQIVVETEQALEKAEEVLEETMRDLDQAWDDVHGKMLSLKKVREGRKEEIDYIHQRRIWSEVSVEECWKKTGKKPVSVKWVDTDKGSGAESIIRCRLVARDFKVKGERDREDLFAATPPLELIRALISRTASRNNYEKVKKMLFIDAKKAHLNPKCDEDVYI